MKTNLWIAAFTIAGTLNIAFAAGTYAGHYDWAADIISVLVGGLCFIAAHRIWQTRS